MSRSQFTILLFVLTMPLGKIMGNRWAGIIVFLIAYYGWLILEAFNKWAEKED